MNPTKLARISALALVLFLAAVSAFALSPCGCNYCQRFPDRECTIDGEDFTCLEFLIVALCPAGETAASADAPSSEAAFLASLSGSARGMCSFLNAWHFLGAAPREPWPGSTTPVARRTCRVAGQPRRA